TGERLFDVGAVAAHPHDDALTDVDGADRAGVDVAEVLDEVAQAFAGGCLVAEIEAAQPLDPALLAGGDLVQAVLHGRGEVIVDEVSEVLLEEARDGEREPGRHESAAAGAHIPAVLDRAD